MDNNLKGQFEWKTRDEGGGFWYASFPAASESLAGKNHFLTFMISILMIAVLVKRVVGINVSDSHKDADMS